MFGRATIRLDIGPHSSFQWSTQHFILRGINFTARSELRKVMFLALSVTFLFVYEISREPLNGFALGKIHTEDVIGPSLGGV